MRCAIALSMALLLAACGSPESASESAAASGETAAPNRPPVILAADLYPSDPTVDQTISLSVDVHDPDRDELQIEVDWLRNGSLYQRGPELTLPASGLERGDELSALVKVTDGEIEVSLETEVVTLQNREPRMAALDLLPADPTGADNLMAVARAVDPEEDDVSFEYRWYRNGTLLESQTGPTLPAAEIRRGNEIRVEVRPRDEDSPGSWTSSRTVQIRNAAPQITSKPGYDIRGEGVYLYDVEATDPDNDGPLRYELLDGPEGMEVDLVTGELTWPVPPSAQGSYTIEVAVADPFGGVARQRYSIGVDWQAPAEIPEPGVARGIAGDEADEADEPETESEPGGAPASAQDAP